MVFLALVPAAVSFNAPHVPARSLPSRRAARSSSPVVMKDEIRCRLSEGCPVVLFGLYALTLTLGVCACRGSELFEEAFGLFPVLVTAATLTTLFLDGRSSAASLRHCTMCLVLRTCVRPVDPRL